MEFKEKTRLYVDNKETFQKLEKYVELIEKHNESINLTGFTGDKLWEEGIYESIVCLDTAFDDLTGKKLLDIGAGAGFPSVPFVIVHPEVELIIFEPLVKRQEFLLQVVDLVKINARVQITRVEDAKMFQYFDYITARAVSELKNLIEASSHIGKTGAKYAFVKGPKAQEEIENSADIIKILRITPEIVKVDKITNKEVNLIVYDKSYRTPQGYPRPWKDIVK